MTTIIFYLVILYAMSAGWRLYLEYKKHVARQRKSNEARSWPSVTGQVVSATIIKSAVPRTPIFTTGYAGLGVGINRGVSSNRLRYNYQPNIDYIYSVNGTQYDGNRISLSSDLISKNEAVARALVRQYHEASPVTVYYSPESPFDATLQRDVKVPYSQEFKKYALVLIVSAVVAMISFFLK